MPELMAGVEVVDGGTRRKIILLFIHFPIITISLAAHDAHTRTVVTPCNQHENPIFLLPNQSTEEKGSSTERGKKLPRLTFH